MIPGYHDHEKFVQAHRQNLLREAEHQRQLAQLSQPDHGVLRHFMAIPVLFLGELRKRLQQQAKHPKQQITHRGMQ